MTAIPFIDSQARRRRPENRVDAATARVPAHGRFIRGPDVAEPEAALVARMGRAHAIACANRTDALLPPPRAAGFGPGDAVHVPAFTFVATAEVVAPVFVDVDADSFDIAPASLAAAIAATVDLTPGAVIPVDLFGQAADHAALTAIARLHGLMAIEDAARSFGGTRNDTPRGFGDVAATGCFPAGPPGRRGDGGSILTDDDRAARLRALRQHGRGGRGNGHVAVGMNSRLDTVQAAIPHEKLAILDAGIATRQRNAGRHATALAEMAIVPRVADSAGRVRARCTVRTRARAALAVAPRAAGVPTAIDYPRALDDQPAFAGGLAPDGVAVSRALAGEVSSPPMYHYLDAATPDRIVAAVRAAGGGLGGGLGGSAA